MIGHVNLQEQMEPRSVTPVSAEGRYIKTERLSPKKSTEFLPDALRRPIYCVIDEKELLDRIDGEKEFLQELVNIFKEEYPVALQEMSTALYAHDQARFKRAAHSLKGVLSNFSAKASAEAAHMCEFSGSNMTWDEARIRLATLEMEISKARAALESLAKE